MNTFDFDIICKKAVKCQPAIIVKKSCQHHLLGDFATTAGSICQSSVKSIDFFCLTENCLMMPNVNRTLSIMPMPVY
jgi:hypothetical protein